MDDFARGFNDADTLLILDIYAAGENPIEGITSEALADRIQKLGGRNARYVASFAEAAETVSGQAGKTSAASFATSGKFELLVEP